MPTITVLLAEDHTVVRQGLRSLLAEEADIQVVGEADNGRAAVQMALQLQPMVAVLDISMPELSGLEATRQIVSQRIPTKIIILSSFGDDEFVSQLTEAGASGYLVKQSAATDLIKAIREVCRGNAFFSPSISQRLLEHYRDRYGRGNRTDRKSKSLTPRELEILKLVAQGRQNKEMSDLLKISIKTVEKHRQGLMDKLRIHDIASLTRYAVAKGLIENPRPGDGPTGSGEDAMPSDG